MVATTGDTTALAHELSLVRRRGLARVQDIHPKLVPIDIPMLQAAAASHQPAQPLTTALIAVISNAVDQLPEGQTQTTARRLFGLDRDLSHPIPSKWRAEARADFPYMSVDDFRDGPERNIMYLLADAIATMSPPAKTVGGTAHQHYIRRGDDHKCFADLLKHHRLVAVTGQTGIGKTTLVERVLAEQVLEGAVCWLDGENSADLINDLRLTLHNLHIDRPAFLNDDPARLLTSLVTADNAPDVVVIDNLMSYVPLSDARIQAARSSLVAIVSTTRNLPRHAGLLRLRPLSGPEIFELVTATLPDTRDDQRERLADAFDGNPLIIEHVCSTIAHFGLDIAEACQALNNGTASFLARIHVDGHGTLAQASAAILTDIRDTDPLAETILNHLMTDEQVTSPEGLAVVELEHQLREQLSGATAGEAPLLCRDALRTLHSYNLISRPDGRIRMNPLTKALLCASTII